MTLSKFDKTYTAGKEGDGTTKLEKNGVVGVLVGSNENPGSVSATAENYSASLTLERNNVPASAYTLILTSAPATFSGSTATLTMTSKDGNKQQSENVDHAGSALLVHGYEENPSTEIDTTKTTKVTFSAGQTTLSTDMQGELAGSTNVLHVEGNARVDFTGSTVNITTKTASNAVVGDAGDFVAGIGICLEAHNAADSKKTPSTANLHTGQNTTLNINVVGTGTTLKTEKDNFYPTGGAAFLAGIYADGGELYAEGDVNVTVNAKAGTAAGLVLNGQSLDHSSFAKFNESTNEWAYSTLGNSVSYDHTSTFAKKLDVNVHSDTGRTVGVLLATPCCDLDGYVGQQTADGKTEIAKSDSVKNNDNREVSSVTKLTVNDLTVNVTKGEENTFASDGILLVNTKISGTPKLVVNGTATITADNALRTAYWDDDGHEADGTVTGQVIVNDDASLTLNGNVSEFKGQVIQEGGKVALNATDGKFFGGALYVKGGSFETAAVYDSTGFEKNGSAAPVLKVFKDASATLGGLTIGAFDVDETHVKVYGGTLAVNGNLDIQAGGKLGMNDGEVLVKNGTATVSGTIAPTANDEAKTEKPDNSLGMLTMEGGSLTLTSTADVDVYRVWLKNGATFSMDPKADLKTELLFRVDGGTVNADQVDWDTAKQGRMKIWKSDSVVNLKSFTASLTTNDTASFKLFDGTMNVGALNVVAGARIGSNAGTINVTGGDSLIMGSVRPLEVNTAGSPIDEPAPETSSTVLNVKGGTFFVGSEDATDLNASNLRVKTLAVSDGAKFANYGTVKVEDSLTVTNAEFHTTGRVHMKTLVLNQGGDFYEYGSDDDSQDFAAHFSTIVLEEGGRYISDDSETDVYIDQSNTIWRGGMLYRLDDDASVVSLKGSKLLLAGNSDAAEECDKDLDFP